ncbi:hypothetical protein EVAR_59313_1 [Eumeta japonica]|uniref:Uncharacterized protein n=1 Tax=Eumeta variegata TaxID=151549 RepID=A0A4C1YCX7_EUMVA|nr:hypothetical protein EVAR_59313_1 [Eumeta japonica]
MPSRWPKCLPKTNFSGDNSQTEQRLVPGASCLLRNCPISKSYKQNHIGNVELKYFFSPRMRVVPLSAPTDHTLKAPELLSGLITAARAPRAPRAAPRRQLLWLIENIMCYQPKETLISTQTEARMKKNTSAGILRAIKANREEARVLMLPHP